MTELIPKSLTNTLASVSDAVCSLLIVANALATLPALTFCFPSKFLVVVGAAVLGYYVDQKQFISSDLYHSGMQAVTLLYAKRHTRMGHVLDSKAVNSGGGMFASCEEVVDGRDIMT
ncbi:Long-chain fatty acid transporter [Phytophthora megakarya]|uniref:Long-chain fatty acid transporter n=1 Tax=Phytophthora megakarya TaxID=4795 RepID=A0A225W8M8_9STRA|nr:Long-chain fatty acid transporter [Phytophthora megakarya]